MEGRVQLHCSDCGLTREVAGEIPEEYMRSFAEGVLRDGWVPRPGSNSASLICGGCLVTYSGHETVDDEPKVQGLEDPRSV